MKHAEGLPMPDAGALREKMGRRKYGTSMTPWKNLGISMSFSSTGPRFGCLGCGMGEWVEGESRSARVEALQRILAHVLVCERQPSDTPQTESDGNPTGAGVMGLVIGEKGQYALVTGECSDADGQALHDRMVGTES